jgi:Rod binding domain-containing protein
MYPAIASLQPTTTTPLESRASQLLQQTESNESKNNKIDKSAKDFESLLLTSWLQGAQESFASVPGGDEDAGADPGSGQLQGLAMQSLGAALTASGGIGLAHSIAQLLHKSDTPSLKLNTIPLISG